MLDDCKIWAIVGLSGDTAPDGVLDRRAAPGARQADRPDPPRRRADGGLEVLGEKGYADARGRPVPDRRGRRVPALRRGRRVRRPGGRGRREGRLVPARGHRRGGVRPDRRGRGPDGDGHLPGHRVAETLTQPTSASSGPRRRTATNSAPTDSSTRTCQPNTVPRTAGAPRSARPARCASPRAGCRGSASSCPRRRRPPPPGGPRPGSAATTSRQSPITNAALAPVSSRSNGVPLCGATTSSQAHEPPAGVVPCMPPRDRVDERVGGRDVAVPSRIGHQPAQHPRLLGERARDHEGHHRHRQTAGHEADVDRAGAQVAAGRSPSRAAGRRATAGTGSSR